MTRKHVAWLVLVPLCAAGMLAITARPSTAQGGSAPAPGPSTATPVEMVDTYNTLAQAILAVDKTETNIVRSILAAAYAHAHAELARAQRGLKAGDAKAARSAVEAMAAEVGQLGTEGDGAVAAVRKRLLKGGHHHNAAEEAKGLYDQGYVVVTRAAKQVFLDASRAIGQQAGAPKAESLEAEWKKVQAAYADLMKAGG